LNNYNGYLRIKQEAMKVSGQVYACYMCETIFFYTLNLGCFVTKICY